MRKFIFFFVVFLFFISCNLPDADKIKSEVVFETTDYQTAIDKARKLNKPIMLHFYANWCPPCKKMRKITFGNKELAELLNTHFINIKLNVDTKEGRIQSAKYNIEGFPVVMLFDKNGEMVYRQTGFHEASNIIPIVKSMLEK
ncbi:MAG: thioredoxin family protein [Flavobacteriales bacterium]|nr:thioredoxin family protein [Flavobacteriales bacterium]